MSSLVLAADALAPQASTDRSGLMSYSLRCLMVLAGLLALYGAAGL